MSNSFQPENSLTNLTINDKSLDDIIKECTIDLGAAGASDHITLTSTPSSLSYTTGSTITFTATGAQPVYSIGSGLDTITIDNSYVFNVPKEWQDCFPDWSRVQDMCKQYPGLKIAFENFKVFYEMIKDDYDNPTPKK